ncbi:MAG: hypothetical protein A3H98_11045 [Bacteroidetes bacterium RIFCSPLOWO2_02_FULL_36_8]|nr:MAG: hypothetical protein A3H98_11045 [Bacteroidetes bacterium RIFCSPLOWO2_02_FULL_36_8]OFY70604.1 MAG: hypothetical protein A3G23_07685 [Bacteroidetes bacterium RIFCSPLOWO2_12_FULL_37_12]
MENIIFKLKNDLSENKILHISTFHSKLTIKDKKCSSQSKSIASPTNQPTIKTCNALAFFLCKVKIIFKKSSLQKFLKSTHSQ